MKKKLCMILLIICLIQGLSMTVLAEPLEGDTKSSPLFTMQDPEADDWGPGTYVYPGHEHFSAQRGLLDLLEFTLDEVDEDYLLEFTFKIIQDPWKSKYGFSLPLIEIYFDDKPGGSTELFRPGARVRFDSKAPWDVMLHITGWWVMAFRPEDREEADKIAWSDPKHPFILDEAQVSMDDRTIQIKIPKKYLGDLSNARFYLLVGAFDSFGPNYYREIKERSDDWVFGGSNNEKYAPRVIEMLVPEGVKQEEVLYIKPDATTYVTVPYISIQQESTVTITKDRRHIWLGLLMVALLLFLIIRIKSKPEKIPQ